MRTIVITGPAGAGKSTIARKLAETLGKCIDIDIEQINYMIVDGLSPTTGNDSAEVFKFNKWDLAGDTIGRLVQHFNDLGYKVIIHGHANEQLMKHIEKHTTITHKILLLPELETVVSRDKGRGKHMSMGESMVREHYNYFLKNEWNDFARIDSTNEDMTTTLQRLVVSIKS